MKNNNEHFTSNIKSSVKQCDYNDKKLNKRCKQIRDGCSTLIKEEKKINTNLEKGCDLKKESNTVRETISNRRDCVTDVERLIRANYAKTELCAQIKNMPESIPKSPSKLTPKSPSKSNEILPYSKGTYSDAKF